jgi:hypothetical protein
LLTSCVAAHFTERTSLEFNGGGISRSKIEGYRVGQAQWGRLVVDFHHHRDPPRDGAHRGPPAHFQRVARRNQRKCMLLISIRAITFSVRSDTRNGRPSGHDRSARGRRRPAVPGQPDRRERSCGTGRGAHGDVGPGGGTRVRHQSTDRCLASEMQGGLPSPTLGSKRDDIGRGVKW